MKLSSATYWPSMDSMCLMKLSSATDWLSIDSICLINTADQVSLKKNLSNYTASVMLIVLTAAHSSFVPIKISKPHISESYSIQQKYLLL